jgi:hypothetical protein
MAIIFIIGRQPYKTIKDLTRASQNHSLIQTIESVDDGQNVEISLIS